MTPAEPPLCADTQPTDLAHAATAATAATEPPTLDAAQARVLGTLMEKARTVPDSYPLSMQALLTGCNQKTARDPVMELTEAEAAVALDGLRARSLVLESSGARVPRYAHNLMRGLGVPEQSAVLLGLLMLRGPQTPGELRTNGERWYRFADLSSVEAFLDELQERPAAKGGPLVVRLPKAPGAREARWAHLLCGTPAMATGGADPDGTGAAPSPAQAALQQRVERLEAEVHALRQALTALGQQLGVDVLPTPND